MFWCRFSFPCCLVVWAETFFVLGEGRDLVCQSCEAETWCGYLRSATTANPGMRLCPLRLSQRLSSAAAWADPAGKGEGFPLLVVTLFLEWFELHWKTSDRARFIPADVWVFLMDVEMLEESLLCQRALVFQNPPMPKQRLGTGHDCCLLGSAVPKPLFAAESLSASVCCGHWWEMCRDVVPSVLWSPQTHCVSIRKSPCCICVSGWDREKSSLFPSSLLTSSKVKSFL